MSSKIFSVEDQYKKHPKLNKEDVLNIIEWGKNEPHLPYITEHEAIIYLVVCNFDLDYTKKVLDKNFTLRTKSSDIFGLFNPDMEQMQNIFKAVSILGIPTQTPEGNRIIITRLINTDYRQFNVPEYLANIDLVLQVFNYLYGPANGMIAILDASNINWAHITKITFSLSTAARYIEYLQEGVPAVVNGIYMVNIGGPSEKLVKMIKPLMKKELADILLPFGDHKNLTKFISPNYLPADYDGKQESIAELHEKTLNIIMENKELCTKYLNKKVNESLRVSQKKTGWYNIF